ncbi:MAG: hypothetical protein RX318_02355 [bacterium]|nr:hypothetical protein [bacterium]
MNINFPSEWGLAAFVLLLGWAAFQTYHELRVRHDELSLPRIDMFYDENDLSCTKWGMTRDPTGTLSLLPHNLFRVGVKNLGNNTIENIKVFLEKIEPPVIRAEPMLLRLSYDKPKEFLLSQAGCNIDPQASVYVDVIEKIIAERYHGKFLVAFASRFGFLSTILEGRYILHLVAQGRDVQPCRKQFIIDIDEDGTPFFQEAINS